MQRRRSQGEFEQKLYLNRLCESPRAKIFVVCIKIFVFEAKGGFSSKTKAVTLFCSIFTFEYS